MGVAASNQTLEAQSTPAPEDTIIDFCRQYVLPHTDNTLRSSARALVTAGAEWYEGLTAYRYGRVLYCVADAFRPPRVAARTAAPCEYPRDTTRTLTRSWTPCM